MLSQLMPPTSSEVPPDPFILLLQFVQIKFQSSPPKCLQSFLAGISGPRIQHRNMQVEQFSTV